MSNLIVSSVPPLNSFSIARHFEHILVIVGKLYDSMHVFCVVFICIMYFGRAHPSSSASRVNVAGNIGIHPFSLSFVLAVVLCTLSDMRYTRVHQHNIDLKTKKMYLLCFVWIGIGCLDEKEENTKTRGGCCSTLPVVAVRTCVSMMNRCVSRIAGHVRDVFIYSLLWRETRIRPRIHYTRLFIPLMRHASSFLFEYWLRLGTARPDAFTISSTIIVIFMPFHTIQSTNRISYYLKAEKKKKLMSELCLELTRHFWRIVW